MMQYSAALFRYLFANHFQGQWWHFDANAWMDRSIHWWIAGELAFCFP